MWLMSGNYLFMNVIENLIVQLNGQFHMKSDLFSGKPVERQHNYFVVVPVVAVAIVVVAVDVALFSVAVSVLYFSLKCRKENHPHR